MRYRLSGALRRSHIYELDCFRIIFRAFAAALPAKARKAWYIVAERAEAVIC